MHIDDTIDDALDKVASAINRTHQWLPTPCDKYLRNALLRFADGLETVLETVLDIVDPPQPRIKKTKKKTIPKKCNRYKDYDQMDI